MNVPPFFPKSAALTLLFVATFPLSFMCVLIWDAVRRGQVRA
jgi:hypothetical protein